MFTVPMEGLIMCSCFFSVAVVFSISPGHQNSPKALYSMVFGPKRLNI